MDFVSSFHATHGSEALLKIRKLGDLDKVRPANNEIVDVLGMGDIDLKTPVNSWTLKNFRVIPSLKKQLLSVGQLDEHGMR